LSPGPGRYESTPYSSTRSFIPGNKGKTSHGKFGEGYGKFGIGYNKYKLACDIDKNITVHDDRSRPGPNWYSPDKNTVKKHFPQYSMGRKLPGELESIERKTALPSPFHYTVKTESTLPTKYRKIGFGYGNKSNSSSGKLSPGPGDYNLSSFTDKFTPSLYIQTRKRQQRRFNRSIQASARDWSLAKPLTGGVFDPNGVVTKQKTVGFNYPPLRPSQLYHTSNTAMYKSNGFGSSKKRNSITAAKYVSDSYACTPNKTHNPPEVEYNSDSSSTKPQ
jgi:hypothetical protein